MLLSPPRAGRCQALGPALCVTHMNVLKYNFGETMACQSAYFGYPRPWHALPREAPRGTLTLSAGSTLILSLLHNPATSNVTFAQLSGSSDCEPSDLSTAMCLCPQPRPPLCLKIGGGWVQRKGLPHHLKASGRALYTLPSRLSQLSMADPLHPFLSPPHPVLAEVSQGLLI